MSYVVSQVGVALKDAFLMAWEVWWALVLGFFISAVVQAWVPREQIEARLAGGGPAAAGMGDRARRGLVVVLVRGHRDRKEPVPEGRVRVCGDRLSVRVHQPGVGARPGALGADRLAVHPGRVPRRPGHDRPDGAPRARVHLPRARGAGARARAAGRQPATSTTRPASSCRWRERLTSVSAWSDVAHNFRGDWQMLYREIAAGFLLAGFIGLLGDSAFNSLFLRDAPEPLPTVENVIVGPLIAVLSFEQYGHRPGALTTSPVAREVGGRAWFTGVSYHGVDLEDPFPQGYRLNDHVALLLVNDAVAVVKLPDIVATFRPAAHVAPTAAGRECSVSNTTARA